MVDDHLPTSQDWAEMNFAPVAIDPEKFGAEWERARGAIARSTLGLLRLGDQELTRHFLSQREPLRKAMEAHSGLQQELDYLKTHIEALEMASARLLCVASRCAEHLAT